MDLDKLIILEYKRLKKMNDSLWEPIRFHYLISMVYIIIQRI